MTGRTKLFHWNVSLQFNPLERAFIAYYATRYGKDAREIVRGMVRKYVQADKTFDPEAFLRTVDKVVIPEERDDKMMQDEIRSQAKEYVAGLEKGKKKSNAPTETMTKL